MLFNIQLAVLLALNVNAAMAQSILGSATYRERMALPPAAIFEATLEDVSRADAPATVVASTRLASPGNQPIAFTITYDPAKILSDHRYVVRSKILVGDKLLFTSDTATPVITRGSPTQISVTLRRVTARQAPTSINLQGTGWQLVSFKGSDGTTLTPDDKAKYTIEFAADGALTARIDCNRGRGGWKSSGPNQIQFGPLALTRAQCPPGSLHDQIVKQWTYVRSYLVKDGHLFLALMADGGIYELEPLPAPKP